MTDNLKKFLEAVSQDKELTDQFTKAETPEVMIALAAKKGFALTAEDIKPEERTCEVSDEELDAVAGGKACACVAGGAGEESGTEGTGNHDNLCWCAIGGTGTGGDSPERQYVPEVRCVCAIVGGGSSFGD